MILTIYTDGGSLKNPGEAAYAFIIYSNGKILHQQNKRIGLASNNVAEYTALICALEYVQNSVKNKVKEIQVVSDSQLMVYQINGLYKVKHPDIKPLHSQVKILELEIGVPVKYTHVLREKNEEADKLVKRALENA